MLQIPASIMPAGSPIAPQQLSCWTQPCLFGQAQGGTTAYLNANFQAVPSSVTTTATLATVTTNTNGFVAGQFVICLTMTGASDTTQLAYTIGQLPWGPISITSGTVFTFAGVGLTTGGPTSVTGSPQVQVLQTLVTAGPNGAVICGINASTNDSAAELITVFETNAAYAPGNNYTATAASSSTITLTTYSLWQQIITGAHTQTIVLPTISSPPSLSNGQIALPLNLSFQIVNFNTSTTTVNSSGGSTVLAMAANTVAILVYNGNAQTDATSWNVVYYASVYCVPLFTVEVPISSGFGTANTAAVNVLNSTVYPAGFYDSQGNWCAQLDPGISWLAIATSDAAGAAITTSGKTTYVTANVALNF